MSTDETLVALRRMGVHFVTKWPWPKSSAEWTRTPNGYRVTCSCDLGSRVAELTDPSEIDFAATSGADLFLRDRGWRQYSNGIHDPYRNVTFIVGEPTARTPWWCS